MFGGQSHWQILVSNFNGSWDHLLQNDLECHGMPATLVGKEELAIAQKFAVLEHDLVIIIVPVECKVKLVEPKTVAFLGVTLGLLDFTYYSIIHRSVSFRIEIKKARGTMHAFQLNWRTHCLLIFASQNHLRLLV